MHVPNRKQLGHKLIHQYTPVLHTCLVTLLHSISVPFSFISHYSVPSIVTYYFIISVHWAVTYLTTPVDSTVAHLITSYIYIYIYIYIYLITSVHCTWLITSRHSSYIHHYMYLSSVTCLSVQFSITVTYIISQSQLHTSQPQFISAKDCLNCVMVLLN